MNKGSIENTWRVTRAELRKLEEEFRRLGQNELAESLRVSVVDIDQEMTNVDYDVEGDVF